MSGHTSTEFPVVLKEGLEFLTPRRLSRFEILSWSREGAPETPLIRLTESRRSRDFIHLVEKEWGRNGLQRKEELHEDLWFIFPLDDIQISCR